VSELLWTKPLQITDTERDVRALGGKTIKVDVLRTALCLQAVFHVPLLQCDLNRVHLQTVAIFSYGEKTGTTKCWSSDATRPAPRDVAV
jgi:hypothetical protein